MNPAKFLAPLLIAFLQPSYSQPPAMVWHEGWGTKLEEHVHEGWQCRDFGFIGVGQNKEKEGSRTNILVVKTDSMGIQEWMTEVGTPNEWDVGICAHETSSGYIIGGGLYNLETDRQERALLKLDKQGEVVWQQTYEGNKAGAIRGIDINEKGEILATGYTNCSDHGYTFIAEEADGFVMKTDSAGGLIWDKPISAPQGTKLRIEKNGNLAIVSTRWVYSGGRDHMDVVLIRTNGEGEEIFTHYYGGDRSDQCFDFDLTLDGGYILAGHTRSYGVINWDYLLMKIDSSGKQEWVRTFGQPRGYDPRWIHDESYGVRSAPDGGYVIAGGSGDEYSYSEKGHPSGSSNMWKAYLVKTDGEGNLLWEAVYPPSPVGNNAAEYITLTEDGGYVVFTDTDSESPPPPNNFGFMKIETDSVTTSKYIELTLTIQGEGQVYPRNKYHLKDSLLTFTASPADGWRFLSWGGDLGGSENPTSITPADHLSVQANFTSTVGFPIKHKDRLFIYPNPVTEGTVTLVASEPMDQISLYLYDLNGREIKRKQVGTKGNQLVTMDLDSSIKGVFVLRISTRKHTSLFKVMVH